LLDHTEFASKGRYPAMIATAVRGRHHYSLLDHSSRRLYQC
jgi:hypothetical protein